MLSLTSREFREYVFNLCKENNIPSIKEGSWAMEACTYWPRMVSVGKEKFPYGDIDACITPILDALQKAGCIDNDVRFCPVILDRGYDPENPRVELLLKRIS